MSVFVIPRFMRDIVQDLLTPLSLLQVKYSWLFNNSVTAERIAGDRVLPGECLASGRCSHGYPRKIFGMVSFSIRLHI